MSAEPSVAVVIPAYNAGLWLSEAIQSALTQMRCDEIVVVDDGSSDDTAAVASGLDGPVRLVRQRHSGTGAARNRGLSQTDAEIIAFLDADDRFTASGLDVRVSVLAAEPACDLVFGHVQRFSSTQGGEPLPEGPLQPGLMPGAMVARRRALERVGQFENATVGYGLHWLLRARELEIPQVMLPDHVIWRRVHGQNTTVRERAGYGEYARALKASLDRRRAAARQGEAR